MALFEDAIPTILENEGGFVDDPRDPGGATNFGISRRFLENLSEKDKAELASYGVSFNYPVTVEDIKNLTPEKAKIIYKVIFWNRYFYGIITSQDIATKVFDAAINMGPLISHKLLQKSINSITHFKLMVDGLIGPSTLYAVNETDEKTLLEAFKESIASRYKAIVLSHPTSQKFLKGWIKRAYSDRVMA